MLALKWTTE